MKNHRKRLKTEKLKNQTVSYKVFQVLQPLTRHDEDRFLTFTLLMLLDKLCDDHHING